MELLPNRAWSTINDGRIKQQLYSRAVAVLRKIVSQLAWCRDDRAYMNGGRQTQIAKAPSRFNRHSWLHLRNAKTLSALSHYRGSWHSAAISI